MPSSIETRPGSDDDEENPYAMQEVQQPDQFALPGEASRGIEGASLTGFAAPDAPPVTPVKM
jgi:hypothetical protein